VQSLPVDNQEPAAHERSREEYEQLYGEYVVMRQEAQRLGALMCEIGQALEHHPELIVVKPSPRDAVAASAIVLTTHPPTLLAIERLATDIRAVMGRLLDLQQTLPANHDPESAQPLLTLTDAGI
jgi:hypothetical protein